MGGDRKCRAETGALVLLEDDQLTVVAQREVDSVQSRKSLQLLTVQRFLSRHSSVERTRNFGGGNDSQRIVFSTDPYIQHQADAIAPLSAHSQSKPADRHTLSEDNLSTQC